MTVQSIAEPVYRSDAQADSASGKLFAYFDYGAHLADHVLVAEASFGLLGGYVTWDGAEPPRVDDSALSSELPPQPSP